MTIETAAKTQTAEPRIMRALSATTLRVRETANKKRRLNRRLEMSTDCPGFQEALRCDENCRNCPCNSLSLRSLIRMPSLLQAVKYQKRAPSMNLAFRWKCMLIAGCTLVFLAKALPAEESDPLLFSTVVRRGESLNKANWLTVSFESASFEDNDYPHCHDDCPPGSAILFSGFDGVIFFQPGASFVYMYVGADLHVAFLKRLHSHDPRYLLFEEWEPNPGDTRRRWAVSKHGACPCECHKVWYREVHLGHDEFDYWKWQFVECTHITCFDPSKPTFAPPASLGKAPQGLDAPEKENSPAPRQGTNPPSKLDGEGFIERKTERPVTDKQSAKRQMERAPDAVELKSALSPGPGK
jgi:hypothetical protein